MTQITSTFSSYFHNLLWRDSCCESSHYHFNTWHSWRFHAAQSADCGKIEAFNRPYPHIHSPYDDYELKILLIKDVNNDINHLHSLWSNIFLKLSMMFDHELYF